MAQQYTQKAVNTFIKGLVTEAGELTFPEDASVAELNCDLQRDGSRRRRFGFNYEAGNSISDFTIPNLSVVTTKTWFNVGNEAGTEFLVVQVDSSLYFYNKAGSNLSSNQVDTTRTSGVTYSVDLTTYVKPISSGAGTAPIEATSINGALVVVSPEINPFYITRDTDTGAFTETQIDFRTRDFEWQGNTTEYYEELASGSVTDERKYDTYNSGWFGDAGDAALTAYIASGFWPSLNLPFFSAKQSDGLFNSLIWDRIHKGTTLTANGSFILDFFAKDRQTVSGLAGVNNSVEKGRFSTVAAYAGRVFYSGITESTDNNSSKILFSPILVQGFSQLGDCFQANDPTAETFSDLLDTDGGVITIPEAYNIRKLHVFGPTLYVFAENGVWTVSGVDDVFRATEFSISKITETGLFNSNTFVSAAGRPYWWSNVGIHTLVAGEMNSVVEQNISLPTIQSFWEDIGREAKSKTIGIYDELNSRILWAYPNEDETTETKFNNFLFLDETLRAFFPWQVEDAEDGSYIAGLSFYSGLGVSDIEYTLVDSDGNEIVDSSGNLVVITQSGRDFSSTAIKFLTVDGNTGKASFGEFSDTTFYDWGNINYSSFAETGYSFMGDLTTKKNAPYLTTYFRVTETGWTSLGNGSYSPLQQSSCKVSYFWDFSKTSSSTPQQAYLPNKILVVDVNDLGTYDYPSTTVNSRLKLRGRGSSMRIRFESEEGKDFHLLGYEVIGARNPRI